MSQHLFEPSFLITKNQRQTQKKQKAHVFWFCGLSGSGKTTIANHLEAELFKKDYHTITLDGDAVRSKLNKDLGFSQEDRVENLRRVAEVSSLMMNAGLVVLASFISPSKESREAIKKIIGEDSFSLIHVDCSLRTCEKRDTKGLYQKARLKQIQNFTGISAPFDKPTAAAFTVHTDKESVSESVKKLLPFVLNKIQIKK